MITYVLLGAGEMIPGELGFCKSFINNTLCIQCDMCRKACPVLNLPEKEDKILKCYAVQANDEVRKKEILQEVHLLFLRRNFKMWWCCC